MSSATINDIAAWLEALAPLELAEEWDSVGLLVGDRGRQVERVMTCLTLTPTTVAEALERNADLVVVHHPMPFRPLAEVTTDATVGRLLWDLIGGQVAIYSAHTAFDSAALGINQRLAVGLGLRDITPLVPRPSDAPYADLGSGRQGVVASPLKLHELAKSVQSFLRIPAVRAVGDRERPIERIAVACGSGGSFVAAAHEQGGDCLVTGEASFHTCLEAEALGIGLLLTGHYASERFAMEQLAGELSDHFSSLDIWASTQESDPLQTL